MGAWKGIFIFLSLVSLCFALPQWGMQEFLKMTDDHLDSDEHGQSEGEKGTTCDCGWTNKARIVGGKETLPNEYPLMAGLLVKSNFSLFCGGSIISTRHILTAAHCTYPMRGVPLSVTIGEHGKTADKQTDVSEVIDVAQTIEHEEYNDITYANDIALLVLIEQISYNMYIGPVCMPTKPVNLVNEYVKILGWGKLGTTKQFSNVLMKVNVRIIPTQVCANNFPVTMNIGIERPTQICTFNKKKDSCEGDSGGPLIWLDPETNRYTLAALVSYGKNKCGKKSPSVNTDVSKYLDWIKKHMKATVPEAKMCFKKE